MSETPDNFVERCISRLRENGASGSDEELAADVAVILDEMRRPGEAFMRAGWRAQALNVGATEAEAEILADKYLGTESEVRHFHAAMNAAIDAALAETT